MKRLFAAALLGLMTAASAHAQVPGGGGITIVTDTSANTVNGPYKLLINGGTVSNPSSGVAEITISGGGTGCTPAGGQTTNIVLYGAGGLCTPALDANITNGDLSLGLVNSAGGTLDLFGSSSGKATITGSTNGTFTSSSPWALSGVVTLTGASNALGTPLTLVGTNITGTAAGLTAGVANGLNSATTTVVVNAATAPTNGQVLTATGSTAANWQTPSGGGGSLTITDGTHSQTAVTTASLGSGLVTTNGSSGTGPINLAAPVRTVTSSTAVGAGDLNGQIIMNVSGGGTLTVPATSTFVANATVSVVNYSASTAAVSTTPTINAGGGCVTATGIPSGDSWQMLSNGTTIDCFQTVSAASGTGTVTSVIAGTGLTGGTITTTGTIAPDFGTATNKVCEGGIVTAGGPTGSATVAPIVTYNACGQITALTSATITPAVGSVTGLGTGVGTALGDNTNATGGFGTVGTSGTNVGLLNANKTDSGANSFTGANTFAEVLGATNATGTSGTICRQGATTCTLLATDCGTTVIFANGSSAVTVTIPASIVPASGTSCIVTIIEGGTAKVSVNGSAVSAASLVSASSYTGTRAAAGAAITLTLATVASTATAYLTGDGS